MNIETRTFKQNNKNVHLIKKNEVKFHCQCSILKTLIMYKKRHNLIICNQTANSHPKKGNRLQLYKKGCFKN